MRLYLNHGRASLDQDMDDWGGNGPRLRCTGIHQTYDTSVNVHFANRADYDAALKATGWEPWEPGAALIMRREGDCVRCDPADGPTCFYGDWGLMQAG